MEPWDGPAMIAFSDGRYLGCTLDRNGLRPHRYYVTEDIVLAASEVGVIPEMDPATILEKGRLQPGKMFLVDFARQSIIRDNELKHSVATERPYRSWLKQRLLRLDALTRHDVARPGVVYGPPPAPLDGGSQANVRAQARSVANNLATPPAELVRLFNLHGISTETLEMLLPPMIEGKKEALGSMGVDTPLACLSTKRRSIFDYFKQLFAQVTNPPMDSIREEVVMAMEQPIGPEGNLLNPTPDLASRLIVSSPVLSPERGPGARQPHFARVEDCRH